MWRTHNSIHIHGNGSKPRILNINENEVLTETFLAPVSIKCLLPKFECKVYSNGKIRNSKHSVAISVCGQTVFCVS